MNDKENVDSKNKVSRVHPFHLPSTIYSRYEILPYECLYVIIKCLENDRRTLYSLLFVNKFFFHTAIRLLYKDSFLTFPPLRFDMKFESAFLSFLQARIIESKVESLSNNWSPSRIVDETLKRFNLKLTASSKSTIHQKITGSKSDSNLVPRMITDYSKLFNIFSRTTCYHLRQQRILQFLKLSRPLNSVQYPNEIDVAGIYPLEGVNGHEISNTNHTSLNSLYCNDDDSEERSQSYQQNQGSDTIDVQQAITIMWCHYNYNYITSLYFSTSQAHIFLPYAKNLVNLDTIFLDRDWELDNGDIDNTIAFIIQNQSSFSKKRPLNIDLNHGSWDYKIDRRQEQAIFNSIGHVSYLSRMRQHRERITQFMRPKIRIYEAVRKPRSLNISKIPDFYNLARNIDTDQLTELCDLDELRSVMGERDSMEAFLRRCENLKTLRIAIFQNETFSWITQRELAGTDKKQLMKLEELEIQCGQNYYTGITSFNDAVRAFASTLRCAKIQQIQSQHSNGIPNPVPDLKSISPIQIDIFTPNNDDLLLFLPRLTTLRVTITGTIFINIGSFNNCPYLEVLEIEFGGKGIELPRTQVVESTGYSESDESLDSRIQQTIIDHSLFPVWNLPRLRSLKLVNMAAMRFDFASLPHMRLLEDLSIQDRNQNYSERDIVKYVIRQQKTAPNQKYSRSSGVFGSLSIQEWSLPNLTCIKLQGPPTAIFCLEYLRLFPRLQAIELGNFSHPIEIQRYPLPLYIDTAQGTRSGESYTSFDIYSYKPILESQLQEFRLSNNVFMSNSNVTSILTTYAPFLEKIFASKIQDRDPKQKGGFLEAIYNADRKNSISNQAIESSLPSDSLQKKPLGQNLLYVYYGQFLSFIDTDNLGLKPVISREPYIKIGIRIYDTWSHTLVPTKSYII